MTSTSSFAWYLTTSMFRIYLVLCLCFAGGIFAWPSPVLLKLGERPRYQYATDSRGDNHLVDLWLKTSDVVKAARYDATISNTYHLYTRNNPTVSQPLLINNPDLLGTTNFDGNKRTVFLIHGWRDSAISDFNSVVVPAFLEAEDVNIIVVDWSEGASSINYRVVIQNTIASGIAVANFIDWLNRETTSSPGQYHVVGHGFGGHQAGIIGRHVRGEIAYITGLDPALVGWVNNIERFAPSDGLYTEVIHTNYINGYLEDLAQVDFYPNGGISMPGCDSNACDHARSFHYFAESLNTGGFTGRQCINYFTAILSQCDLLPGRLQMGGLTPKTGSTGIYFLETNAAPPFSLNVEAPYH